MSESGGLNDRIVSKIKGRACDESVKKFLLIMLGYGLDHASQGVYKYTQDYKREIDRAMSKRSTE